MSNIKSTILISFLIIFFCLLLVNLLLSIFTYVDLGKSRYKAIQDISENWIHKPILSISSKYKQCQAGEESLFTDEWSGTSNGCDCTKVINLYAELSRGRCTRGKNSDQRYCDDVSPIDSILYTQWDSRNICGRRMNKMYFNLFIERNSSNCPDSMKKCGRIDSFDNILCIPVKEDCPINKILFKNKTEIPPNDFNYTTVELENQNIYYTNENINGKVLVQFKISEDIPCIDTQYSSLLNKPYLLSKNYEYSSCPVLNNDLKFDTRMDKLNTMNKLDLEKSHGIDLVTRTLPLFEKTKANENINLYSNNFIGINKYCRDSILLEYSNDMIINSFNDLEEYTENSRYWSNISIIMTSIQLGLFLFVLITKKCSSNQNKQQSAYFIFLILFLICGIISMILLPISTSKVHKIPYYQNILDCLDDLTDALSNDYKYYIKISKNTSLAYAIITGIILIFSLLIHILFSISDEDQIKYEEQTYQNDNQPQENTQNIQNINNENEMKEKDIKEEEIKIDSSNQTSVIKEPGYDPNVSFEKRNDEKNIKYD